MVKLNYGMLAGVAVTLLIGGSNSSASTQVPMQGYAPIQGNAKAEIDLYSIYGPFVGSYEIERCAESQNYLNGPEDLKEPEGLRSSKLCSMTRAKIEIEKLSGLEFALFSMNFNSDIAKGTSIQALAIKGDRRITCAKTGEGSVRCLGEGGTSIVSMLHRSSEGRINIILFVNDSGISRNLTMVLKPN